MFELLKKGFNHLDVTRKIFKKKIPSVLPRPVVGLQMPVFIMDIYQKKKREGIKVVLTVSVYGYQSPKSLNLEEVSILCRNLTDM